jgi:hypothetical protein
MIKFLFNFYYHLLNILLKNFIIFNFISLNILFKFGLNKNKSAKLDKTFVTKHIEIKIF